MLAMFNTKNAALYSMPEIRSVKLVKTDCVGNATIIAYYGSAAEGAAVEDEIAANLAELGPYLLAPPISTVGAVLFAPAPRAPTSTYYRLIDITYTNETGLLDYTTKIGANILNGLAGLNFLKFVKLGNGTAAGTFTGTLIQGLASSAIEVPTSGLAPYLVEVTGAREGPVVWTMGPDRPCSPQYGSWNPASVSICPARNALIPDADTPTISNCVSACCAQKDQCESSDQSGCSDPCKVAQVQGEDLCEETDAWYESQCSASGGSWQIDSEISERKCSDIQSETQTGLMLIMALMSMMGDGGDEQEHRLQDDDPAAMLEFLVMMRTIRAQAKLGKYCCQGYSAAVLTCEASDLPLVVRSLPCFTASACLTAPLAHAPLA
jgi:hypothetical protein